MLGDDGWEDRCVSRPGASGVTDAEAGTPLSCASSRARSGQGPGRDVGQLSRSRERPAAFSTTRGHDDGLSGARVLDELGAGQYGAVVERGPHE